MPRVRPVETRLFNAERFARSVRVYCAELHITYKEAANLADIKFPTFVRVCSGLAPDIETYFRLCCWMKKCPLPVKEPT